MTNLTKQIEMKPVFYKISKQEYAKNFPDVDIDDFMQVYDDIKLPERATVGSAGYDFFAPTSIELYPGESAIIPTGINCTMSENMVLLLFPRSGMGFKYRCQLDNTVGVIDSDYICSDNEGHIMAKITNDSRDNKVLNINKGQAFMQGVFVPYYTTTDDRFENAESSAVIKIRNGGFGSTDEEKLISTLR